MMPAGGQLSLHDFVFHHRDMRGRPAERCRAQAQEKQGELAESGLGSSLGFRRHRAPGDVVLQRK